MTIALVKYIVYIKLTFILGHKKIMNGLKEPVVAECSYL